MCPICSKVDRIVCNKCLSTYNTLNENGHEITFGNISISGGFYCKNMTTGEMFFDTHICYINNVKCWADNMYFGKIVISALS